MVSLIEGGIYRVRARNFDLAVYNGHGGFIGLRQKFNVVFLFTEYAWELGGTVPGSPRELLGQVLPGVPLEESGKIRCKSCRSELLFNQEYRRWDGCSCSQPHAVAGVNRKLHQILMDAADTETKQQWKG